MISGDNFPSCGIGNFDVAKSGWTVSIVTKECAETSFSFGHELCHNMGCAHNIEDDTNPKNPYAFGHFLKEGNGKKGFRSIMAYPDPWYPTRVNYYSNPAVEYPETGTPTGVAGSANNVAVLLKNRFKMAKLGDESIKC